MNDRLWEAFTQGGVALLVLGVVFWLIYRAGRWLGVKLIEPAGNAFVNYLESQTKATAAIQVEISSLAQLESDIRDAITGMVAAHRDTESNFATVHTDASIKLLARAVGRIGRAINADVDELVQQIELELKHRGN